MPYTHKQDKQLKKMRITQVRDDGKVNTMRTLKIERLVEQMKKETKAQPVSNMREVLPYMLPGDKNDYIEKVPKILPAAVFVRENGVVAMSEYNGIVMLQVNGLSGHMEADEVKECVKELPQTYLAFIGSSGKSVKIWVRFTYPDNRLPDNREQAEVFHAHAYRLAVKKNTEVSVGAEYQYDKNSKEWKMETSGRISIGF